MDKKRLIIAIVLSSVVVILWAVISPLFITQNNPPPQINISETREPDSPNVDVFDTRESESVGGASVSTADRKQLYNDVVPVENTNLLSDDFIFETDKFKIVFSPRGGLVKSLKLQSTPELNNTDVNMILSGNTGIFPFSLNFADFSPDEILFEAEVDQAAGQVKFYRKFKNIYGDTESEFLLIKQFSFYKSEYIFDISIIIEKQDPESRYLAPEITNYTMEFGPQLGPEFIKLDNTNEFRRTTYFSDGKRVDFSNKVKNGYKLIDKSAKWIAIEGKYFIAICYPPKEFLDPDTLGFDKTPLDNFPDVTTMVFKRPAQNRTAAIEDKYQFYVGPKKKEFLNLYANKSFDQAVKPPSLNWLAEILKMLLLFLQKVVNNWGLAIILMTLIIKILLFPLTQKSFKSNTKMQALAPKLNELKEKYKDDQQKMQTETAALYKREGINPLGGCLPLLIQMPIFIALYGLLNTHFELRGAVFIPGWIDDLSLPETFISLPDAFLGIPVIGNQLRLLPFLMVGMTLLQQKFSQSPAAATTGQMKIMMYAMPLVFFVIMYNMPAGLVVYWTVQNLLSVFQQIYINKLMKNEKKDSTGFMDKIKQIIRRK